MSPSSSADSTDGDANRLDFLQGVRLMPWEWRNLGALFGAPGDHAQLVAGRAQLVARRGRDEDERADYGRVLEGLCDVGLNLRSGPYAFHLGAANLAYRSGTDAPLRAQQPPGGGLLAGLRLAFAQEVAEDRYLGVSYDLRQRKPELSAAWAGDAITERASLAVSVDPVDRAARLAAAVEFPGPDWRVDVYNPDTRRVEPVPVEAGARHVLWVQHEARRGRLLAATRAGARLDLGRAANLVGAWVDRHVEPRVPYVVWRLPLSQALYRALVPRPDDEQLRYRLRGWALEAAHDFDAAADGGAGSGVGSGLVVGVSKRLGGRSLPLLGGLTAAATYDVGARAAGAELRARGLVAAARLGRAEDGSWRSPTVQLLVQPLSFL